jgi:hypothetical protein
MNTSQIVLYACIVLPIAVGLLFTMFYIYVVPKSKPKERYYNQDGYRNLR